MRPHDDPAAMTADERLRRKSTPLVRKMAAEHKLDISAIAGTGHAGRVTKHDVEAFLESAPAASAAAAPASKNSASRKPNSPATSRSGKRCTPSLLSRTAPL